MITYQEFLHQLMQPECADVVDIVRRFLGSVLGPNGDCSPPSRGAKLDYTFVGAQDIQYRCPDFLNSMETYMNNHAVWKNLSEAHKTAVRDHLEKYILTKLYDVTFPAIEDQETDNLLLKRMKVRISCAICAIQNADSRFTVWHFVRFRSTILRSC